MSETTSTLEYLPLVASAPLRSIGSALFPSLAQDLEEQLLDTVAGRGRKFSKLEALYSPLAPPAIAWRYECQTCRFWQDPNGCSIVGVDDEATYGPLLGGPAIGPRHWCALWLSPEAVPPLHWLRSQLDPRVLDSYRTAFMAGDGGGLPPRGTGRRTRTAKEPTGPLGWLSEEGRRIRHSLLFK